MRIYVSLLLLCLSCLASAQTPKLHKTVYLKDGSNVRGLVTVNDSAGYVIVIDGRHQSHYFDTGMIARIEDKAPNRFGGYDLKPRGYVCSIELGGSDIVASRFGASSVPGFTLDVVNSYQFSPYVSLGFGLGAQLSSSGYNMEMVSAYADSRFYFMKSRVGPYLDIAAGYCGMFMKYTDYDSFSLQLPTVREMDNGLMFNPSLGIRVGMGRDVAMTASMGYKLYYLLTPDNVYYLVSGDATFAPDAHGYYLFNAITLKVGFQF